METTIGSGAGSMARIRATRVDTATLARNWWAVALRGLAALVFGGLTIVVPEATVGALLALFGSYAFADGALYIVAALRRRETDPHWSMLLLAGGAGIVVAVLTFSYPGMTVLVLVYTIAAWAIVTGVAQVVAAVRLRCIIRGEWLLGISGMLSMLFGLFLAAAPGVAALALALWVGGYALVAGVVLLGLGVRLRRYEGAVSRQR
jgi:uncharacterized membrane protein HdeD (DUF308 family)